MALVFLCSPAYAAESYDLIVVRADIPTEYVVASVYANSKNIPVVLVSPDEISESIYEELQGYVASGYTSLLLVGGNEAIAFEVEKTLNNMGFNVRRLWDWNREGTAARVAVELWEESKYVVLVNGANYDNLLAAQRFAMKNNIPVLYTIDGTVPEETRTAMEKIGARKAFLFETVKEDMGIETELISPASSDIEKKVTESEFSWVLFAIFAFALVAVIFISKVKLPSSILTKEERKIIYAVKRRAVKQNELPGITGFSKPKVSRLVQNLEKRGLVSRKKIKKTYLVESKTKI